MQDWSESWLAFRRFSTSFETTPKPLDVVLNQLRADAEALESSCKAAARAIVAERTLDELANVERPRPLEDPLRSDARSCSDVGAQRGPTNCTPPPPGPEPTLKPPAVKEVDKTMG
ncbi:uncharacterized protein A4U43_C07F32350 [Asparagus officinalis]|uniref:Uncharacterized protein n=1 Tax=Asparagus officinalis TaxID=4686 RepID=A0A5P1EGM7_ASPOF|nr:uncharacterized protein A4U43_C07F32350 [Asparagus officinalis]